MIPLIVALALGAPAGELPTSEEVPRLRSADPFVVALVAEGLGRSETFRRLYERLERSDVIAHVRRSRFGLEGTGRNQFVTQAGAYRFVQLTLVVTKPTDDAVALLGHELQHAVELADAPAITDVYGYGRLYERIGYPSCPGGTSPCYETETARRAGRSIRRELRRYRPPGLGAAIATAELVHRWLKQAATAAVPTELSR